MSEMSYDIFLSYAHTDRAFATCLVEQMRPAFKNRARRQPRIFFDAREIATAADWRRRIHVSLERSEVLVAVLSPDYFSSQWCGREWDYFIRRERDLMMPSKTGRLGLIYPVWPDLQRDLRLTDPPALRRLRDSDSRQHVDFTGVSPGTGEFQLLASNLVQDIWAELQLIKKINYTTPTKVSMQNSSELDSVEQPLVTTRYGGTNDRFVSLLAEAVNVTIVGITNQRLADSLEKALARKRSSSGAQAFWQSIRVVFLAEELLPYVNDDLSTRLPSRKEALAERRNHSGFGKRTVASFFLHANQPNRWRMFEYSYMLPFIGTIFDMPDGSRIVQIGSMRPRSSLNDQLFWEFEDRVDKYFAETFQEIVKESREENEVVLVGSPIDDATGFYCRGARFRRSAMLEGANVTDWLPAIIVATWRSSSGAAIPLLQVNTKLNSTREIGKVSHVSGYINQTDYLSQFSDENGSDIESEFHLSEPIARNAVRRELFEELHLPDAGDPGLFAELPFYYPNKENLYFYLFELCMPAMFTSPATAEMHSWTIAELLRLREYQVLGGVRKVLSHGHLQPQQRDAAVEIAALNLVLHGQQELADMLGAWAQGDQNAISKLQTRLDDLLVSTRVGKYSAGQELRLSGLAGLQYREFFSAILPLYSHIGVLAASDHLRRLQGNDVTASAIARLATLYHDEAIMMSLPIEL